MVKVEIAVIEDGEITTKIPLERKGDKNRFNSGSMGFTACGIRTQVDGKQHILGINAVEVGSKNK